MRLQLAGSFNQELTAHTLRALLISIYVGRFDACPAVAVASIRNGEVFRDDAGQARVATVRDRKLMTLRANFSAALARLN